MQSGAKQHYRPCDSHRAAPTPAMGEGCLDVDASVSPMSEASRCMSAMVGLQQYDLSCVEQQEAAEPTVGGASGIHSASWQLPADCMQHSWDASCSSGSLSGAVYDTHMTAARSGSFSISPARHKQQQEQLDDMLISPEQHQNDIIRRGNRWTDDQQFVPEHIENQMRLGAGPSFSGWQAPINADSSNKMQHTAVQQLQQLHLHGSQCQPLPLLDKQQPLQLPQAPGSCLYMRRRMSSEGGGATCSGASSGSFPDLPASFSKWGSIRHAELSHAQPALSLSLSGASGFMPEVFSLPQAQLHSPAVTAAVDASHAHGKARSSSLPMLSSCGNVACQSGIGTATQRKQLPAPVQLPQSPRRSCHAIPAVPAPAAEGSSSSVHLGPSPPVNSVYAPCASPKVNLLYQKLKGSGSSASSAAFAVSPSVSPAVQPQTHQSCDASKDISSTQLSAHQQPAAALLPGSLAGKHVCRDISMRLEACSDAQQQSSRQCPSWQAMWQQQSPSHVAMAGTGSADRAAAVGPPTAACAEGKVDLPPSHHARQHHQVADSKSAPLHRGSHPPGVMSPAPPLVPPSPAQQAAAALRRPCSSPTAQQLLAAGWTPTTRQPAWVSVGPGAGMANDASGKMGVASGGACRPGSPRGFVKPVQDGSFSSSKDALLPLPAVLLGTSKPGSVTEQEYTAIVQGVGIAASITGAMPRQRSKPESIMQDQHQQAALANLEGCGIDEADLHFLCAPVGFGPDMYAEQLASSIGSMDATGRLSDPGAVRCTRTSDQGSPGLGSTLLQRTAGIMGRHSDQGISAGAAALQAASAHAVLSKHLHLQQHAGAPPRPPLHHHGHTQQHWLSTPKTLPQLDLQQFQHRPHTKVLRRSTSADQQQLLQQQHPMPPKQTAPLCRSPCVAKRTLASPAAAPAFLQAGHLQPGHIRSPEPEQQGHGSNDGSGNMQNLLMLGTSESQSSSGGTPADTPLSSGAGLSSLAQTGALSSIGSGAGSSRVSRASGHQALLPRPAFEQPHILLGLNAPCTSANVNDSPSIRAAADDRGIQHSAAPQHGSPGRWTIQEFQDIRRSILGPTCSSVQHASSTNRSSSSAATAGQSHLMTPHPPGMGTAAALLSPRAGMGVQLAAVHAPGVQPCPPHSSQPSAPSPSVRTRLAHGQHHTAPGHLGQHMVQAEHGSPGCLWLQACDMPNSGVLAADSSSNLHILPSTCRRRMSASGVQQPTADVSLNSSLQQQRAKSSSHVQDAVGQTKAWAADGTGDTPEGYTLGSSQSWECGEFCLHVDTSAQLLTPVDETDGDADGAESACTTPNMDWDAAQPQQKQEQQQEQSREWQLPPAQQGAQDAQPSRHTADQPVQTVVGKVVSSHKVSSSRSCSSSSSAAPYQDEGAASSPSPAVPAAQFAGCPGWATPVVAAYAHYKGRLGYLLSSGVVGVVFEDSTHMIVRCSDGMACYHECGSSSGAAALSPEHLLLLGSVAEAQPGGSSNSASKSRRCSDTGGSAGLLQKDQGHDFSATAAELQDTSSKPPSMAAAMHSSSGSLLGGQAVSGEVVFLLPLGSSTDSFAERQPHSTDQYQRSSKVTAAAGVPEHLAAKARCLRRFVGCLLHHRPYSRNCQPDITRLPFPVTRTVADVKQQQQVQQQDGPMHSGVPHLRRFVHREGCLHLKLTDGSTQLVFTGDSSVLLLDSQCSYLAYVTYSKHRRTSDKHTAAAPGAEQSSPAKRAAGAASVALMPLHGTSAAPTDTRLLVRAAYASKLVKALHLPPSWLEATGRNSP